MHTFNLQVCVWVDVLTGDVECVRLARICEAWGDGSMGDVCETKGPQAVKCMDEGQWVMTCG